MIPRRRRSMMLGALGTLAAPHIAAAQTGRSPRLAMFWSSGPLERMSESGTPLFRTFFGELRRRGYEEGRSLVIERWTAGGDSARFDELAHMIAKSKPDVVYASSTGTALALQAATKSIPIVAGAADMINTGLADSLARPGRNVTGYSPEFGTEIWLKRLQLLHETIPTSSRIALLCPRSLWDWPAVRRMREMAPGLGVTLIAPPLDEPVVPPEIRRAFAAMADQRADALVIAETPLISPHYSLIIELAAAHRLPAIGAWPGPGVLMSYGWDLGEVGRVAADYVVRILQGEKPAEMPIRLIDKYELVINLKIARTLGLTIPPAILARADEVIE
jgi:putative ABC transport system substrate-binding protein